MKHKKQKNKIKNIIIVSCLILIVVGASLIFLINNNNVTGNVVHEKLTPVKIGYREHLVYLPAYIAQVNNYYEQEGLDVKLIAYDSTNQLVEAVINGQIDAGVGGINPIAALSAEIESPGTLIFFSQGIFTNEFDYLLVAKDSKIKTVKDLEGKTISSLPGSAAKIWMKLMVEKEQLENVKIIQTKPSQQLNALSSGSVDAIFVLEPLARTAIDNNIAEILVKSPINIYAKKNMTFALSIMKKEYYTKNKETAKKIIQGTDNAITFINKNPEISKQYYSEFCPIKKESANKLPIMKYMNSKELDIKGFQEVADFLADKKILSSRINTQKLFVTN